MADRPPYGDAPAQPARAIGSPPPDPERIVAQALKAMAGGAPMPHAGGPAAPGGASAAESTGGGLTTVQVLLIAAIIGAVVGMGVALVLLAVG